MPDAIDSQSPASPGHNEDAAIELLSELGVALCEAGTPSHRLEDALAKVAEVLGVRASFFASPTAVFAAFERPGGSRISLLRVRADDTDLSRVIELAGILDEVLERRISADEAIRRIAAARARPPRYGPALSVACFACVAACAARVFGGGAAEIAVAPLAGLAIGLISVYGPSRLAPLNQFLAGAMAAVLAAGASALFPAVSPRIVMLASLIVLIPGLALTIAVNELATRNLVAGTARLMGALITFVGIGFGVAVGQQLVQHILPSAPDAPAAGAAAAALPDWTLPLALAAVAFPLAVLFRARPRDIPVIMGSAFVAFYGGRFGAWALGPEAGVCIAAILVGVASNLYARRTGNPAAVPLLPGVLLLVPGSVGFESVNSFVAKDALAGVATAFEMIFIAISLVAGLLIANASAPARRPL